MIKFLLYISFFLISGAEIWFQVDATDLHNHERLKLMLYDCVIFNFPHVGGKMKIHLNRQLLKNFFTSVSQLLSAQGRVLVSLCRGQSGTCYDSVRRNFDDSWQVVEMAAYGDLVLKAVTPLQIADWPGYQCNGYRSLNKGFLLEGALTFTFSKFALNISEPVMQIPNFNSTHCPHVENQLLALHQTAFANFDTIRQQFTQSTLVVSEQVLNLCSCSLKERTHWWQTFSRTIRPYIIHCLIHCQPCHLAVGDAVERIFLVRFPSNDPAQPKFLNQYRSERVPLVGGRYDSVTDYFAGPILIGTVLQERHDRLVSIYMNQLIRLIENFTNYLPSELSRPRSVKSLHPPEYCHDLSFWIAKNASRREVACALRCASFDCIRRVELIDDFQCNKTGRHSLCYRLVYQSFGGALSADKAWHLHLNVVGKSIERTFAAVVR